MANIDNPRGLWPIRHLCGGEIRTTRYQVKASATIYRGDPLIIDGTGTVTVAAAGSDQTAIIGVAAHYAAAGASGVTNVDVYDDPNIVFGIQGTSSTTPEAADVFGGANMITYAAGNTTTGVSIIELDDPTTGAVQFKIIGLVDSPDNTWGEHCDMEVIFNEHFYLGARPNAV